MPKIAVFPIQKIPARHSNAQKKKFDADFLTKRGILPKHVVKTKKKQKKLWTGHKDGFWLIRNLWRNWKILAHVEQ